jgi:hypothetical protein
VEFEGKLGQNVRQGMDGWQTLMTVQKVTPRLRSLGVTIWSKVPRGVSQLATPQVFRIMSRPRPCRACSPARLDTPPRPVLVAGR